MRNDSTTSKQSTVSSLVLAIILPQLTLLALNIRGWLLVRQEAKVDETTAALIIFSAELSIILGTALVLYLVKNDKLQATWKLWLVSLIIHISYIWLTLTYQQKVIPDSIQSWILNSEDVGRWGVTLFMPGAFISLLYLSRSYFQNVGTKQSVLTALLATIGTPVLWYLLVSVIQPAYFNQFTTVASILLGTILIVGFLGAIIQIFDKLIHKASLMNRFDKHYLVALILGLVAPLAGLWLNSTIPFPVDLQSSGVYAFTIVNGLLLLIKPAGLQFVSTRLFARCVTFPFILYFFLVFLPFLPLSIFAILAVGAGFLMLTPLALGLFQAKISLDDYQRASAILGKKKTRLIATAGLCVLPGLFLVQASLDKQALGSSLDYFYAHNPNSQTLSSAQVKRASAALIQLQERKTNIQLPYLAGMYNGLVFGDMVLSDEKIDRLYHLLSGEDIAGAVSNSFMGRSNASRGAFRTRLIAPQQEIEVASLKLSTTSADASTLSLVLENSSSDTHSLFVGQLELPQGVFISGLRLKIEEEWVDAQIFDRKTALWVFQKITEVRRDPALLFYRSSGIAELRVYPFPSKGVREVEIDFRYHPQIDARISFADHAIDLNPNFNSASLIAPSGEVLISEHYSRFAFERAPYLHFILDYSSATSINSEEFARRILQTRRKLNINEFRLSAANISTSGNASQTLLNSDSSEEIAQLIDNLELSRIGGLWLDQAFQEIVLQTDANLQQANIALRPVLVVLSDSSSRVELDLEAWHWKIPDMPAWYWYRDDELVEHKIAAHHEAATDIALSNTSKLPSTNKRPNLSEPSNTVVALSDDSGISVYSSSSSSLYKSALSNDLKVYSADKQQFVPLIFDTQTPDPTKQWSSAAKIWSEWRQLNLDKSSIEIERSRFLAESKANSVLLPLTSFIAVEAPSQWEILRRKEQQSLNNHSGLDFEEEQQTPEPPWWLLLIALLTFVYFRDKKNHHRKPI